MTDRRVLKSNGRVADLSLDGQVSAERFVAPRLHRVSAAVMPILDRPGGGRERELAFGEGFEVLEVAGEHAFGYAARDGYVGYVPAWSLSDDMAVPTHRVVSPGYWFDAPSLKCGSPPGILPMGALLSVSDVTRDHCDWAEVRVPAARSGKAQTGHVPMPTLVSLADRATDPVAEAARYLGVPYLWGGNSGFGIDCSGLVQAAFLACGVPCPGDSDQQAAGLGAAMPAGSDYRRGDLIFWKGHVGLVVGDGRLLHANAHHMVVAYEDLDQAIARIAAKEGPVTRHRRVTIK